MKAAARWIDTIALASVAIGREVRVDLSSILDRGAELSLGRAGLWSPNRNCRLVRAADGWIALNLAREDDRDLVSAWLGRVVRGDVWRAVIDDVRKREGAALIAQGRLLGLPVSVVGEIRPLGPPVKMHRLSEGGERGDHVANVVDLTSLWAGPLCAGVLAQAGADVVRYESVRRPDPTRTTTPAFFARLNGGKRHVMLDFADSAVRTRLRADIAAADVIVTSARPRAFAELDITPEAMIMRNPRLIWVAITGYGWFGDGAGRVAFGDDAAAAGGLIRRTPRGDARFAGDALADPLSGLAAAAAALTALQGRGGVLIDVAMARVAAHAAATG